MSPMNTRLIAAAEAVMVAAVMVAAGCGSAATSAPMPTPSPTHSVMSLAASDRLVPPRRLVRPTRPRRPPRLRCQRRRFLSQRCLPPATPPPAAATATSPASTAQFILWRDRCGGRRHTDHLSRQQRLAVGTGLRHDSQRQPVPLRCPRYRRRRHGRVPGRPAARARRGGAAGRRRDLAYRRRLTRKR